MAAGRLLRAEANDPRPFDAPGVLSDAYTLANAVGSPALALFAVSAFVAYLIGLLSVELSQILVSVATQGARRLSGQTRHERRGDRQSTVIAAPDSARRKIKDALRRWAGSGDADLSLRGEAAAVLIAEDRERRIESALRREGIS